MQKTFIKILSILMTIIMSLTVFIIFTFQTYTTKHDIIQNSKSKISQIKQIIEKNTAEIKTLTKSLNEDYLAKTRAFAYIIKQNPSILENSSELDKIRTLLNVDEFHVTDENGILKWGTNPDIFGFDFKKSEQTNPFIPMLTDKTFEIAQEPQINGTKGELFQYIGVPRIDKAGIVQIGMRPERLESALANSDISKVLAGISVGNNGYIFAVNNISNKILYHTNIDYIGKTLEELGMHKNFKQDSLKGTFFKFNDLNKFYVSENYNDMLICVAISKSDLYRQRNYQVFILLISVNIIFAFLIFIINKLLKKIIISGVYDVINCLIKITKGDLNIIINVRQCDEFIQLSDGINDMVKSIKSKMNQTEKLILTQNKILESVKCASTNINEYSYKMMEISASINQGTTEQSDAVQELSNTIDEISIKISESVKSSFQASHLAIVAKEKLIVGNSDIEDMVIAMEEIAQTSNKIVEVVNTINNISFQTNILALNATIEAARAGEAGKGFTVVADEVRKLASKSADASNVIGELIDNAVTSINKGTDIAKNTVNTLLEVMIDAQKATEAIQEISAATTKQADSLVQISENIFKISSVVNKNSQTVKYSSDISQRLSEQAKNLTEIVLD